MKVFNRPTLFMVFDSSRLFLGKMQQVARVLSRKRRHPFLSINEKSYRKWLIKNEPAPEDFTRFKEEAAQFKYKPIISTLVPVFDTPKQYLEKAIESVLNQVYENWELCIVNDGSPQKQVRQILDAYKKKDQRIKVNHLPKNKGIAEATNAALSMATGEFVAFMDSDDALPKHALFEVARFINQHLDADVIFSDEDKITLADERRRPEFKPDWDPELFLTYNYINHLTVCRKTLVDYAGGFRAKYNWSQDYDLYLRITEKTSNIYHIPQILYHWREIPGSSASRLDIRPLALAKSIELLNETLQRRGINGTVKKGLRPGTFKIVRI